MPFTLADITFSTDLPDIPATVPVPVHPLPCLERSDRPARSLAALLDLHVTGTVDVPHGSAVGGHDGQVEVFAASGALRARNTERLSAYPDERRHWRDVDRTDEGFQLGRRSSEHLSSTALEILERVGLHDEHHGLDVVLGQWALLDETGGELESGPGRATVRLSYAVEGVPLIGPGAKTNLHFDPDQDGGGGVLARFFHVRRSVGGTTEVRTQSLEETFTPLLTQTWAGLTVDPGAARMSITSASFGLLALPADVPQGHAAPALAVEGRLSGAVAADGRELDVRFGRYLPLAHPEALAGAGLGSSGQLSGGQVVRGRVAGK